MIVSNSVLPSFAVTAERTEPVMRRDAERNDVANRDTAVRDSGARDAVRRTDDGDSDTNDKAPKSARKVVKQTRPQFARLLALLNHGEQEAQAETSWAAPAQGVSLLERLLNGAGTATTAQLSGTDAALPSNGASLSLVNGDSSGQRNNDSDPLKALNAFNARNASETEAMDALRYGLMQDVSRDASASKPDTTTRSILSAPSRGARNTLAELKGISANGNGADVSSATDVGANDSDAPATSAAMRALARISGKRAARPEQLLALGDTIGAKARAALDRVLSHAGTPDGALLADAGSNAALSAAAMNAAAIAAASAAANVAAVGDVKTLSKDPNAMAPELRAKLDRVIARMRDEYGSDVGIVETTRTQERQDYLYAQGRTRPGDVVTWTKDSAHTRGEAVDVVVDGSWNNAEGFARLQRIAREEGLRTLGIKDPGHLELPRDASRSDASVALSALTQRANAAAAAANTPAGVAEVATVAGVASVARIADRGTPSGDASSNAAVAAYTQRAGGNADSASSNDPRDSNRDNGRDSRSRTDAADGPDRAPRRTHNDSATSNASLNTQEANTPTSLLQNAATESPTALHAVSAADRVAEVQRMQADAPAGAMSRMTLDVEGPNGPQRITVDLRGNSVGTHITTDAESADRMRLHTGELADALGRLGLTADSVRISNTVRLDTNAAAVRAERDAAGVAIGAAAQSNGGDQAAGQGAPRDKSSAREWEREFDKQEQARKSRDEQRQNSGQRGQRGTFNQDAR